MSTVLNAWKARFITTEALKKVNVHPNTNASFA